MSADELWQQGCRDPQKLRAVVLADIDLIGGTVTSPRGGVRSATLVRGGGDVAMCMVGLVPVRRLLPGGDANGCPIGHRVETVTERSVGRLGGASRYT